MSKSVLNILIAEDEEDLRDYYTLMVGSQFDAQFYSAVNAKEAIKHLESGVKIDMVISDYNMPVGNGSDLYKWVLQKQPHLPFILVTSNFLDDLPEFKNRDLTSYVQKPFTEQDIIAQIQLLLARSAKPVYKVEVEYIPVSIQTLYRMKNIFSPLYIKISDEKYIKLFNSDMVFNQTEYDRMISKGTEHLYVLHSDYTNFIEKFKSQVMSEMIFTSLKKSNKEIFKISGTIQDLLSESVKVLGISTEVVDLVNQNIVLVGNIINSQPEFAKFVDTFKSEEAEPAIYHSMMLCYVTTYLTKNCSFHNKRAMEMLALACFFHDVHLSPSQVRNEAKFINGLLLGTTLNKADLESVGSHIEKVIKDLSAWQYCPSELKDIILHHHEKPDGSGFPKGSNPQKYDELTAAFIVAHDLIDTMQETKNHKTLMDEFEKKQLIYGRPKFTEYYSALMRLIAG